LFNATKLNQNTPNHYVLKNCWL